MAEQDQDPKTPVSKAMPDLRNIPESINKRLSEISFDKECFDKAKSTYQDTLVLTKVDTNTIYHTKKQVINFSNHHCLPLFMELPQLPEKLQTDVAFYSFELHQFNYSSTWAEFLSSHSFKIKHLFSSVFTSFLHSINKFNKNF